MAFSRRGGAGARRGAWPLIAVLVLAQACAIDREAPIEDRLVLEPVTFQDLPGWEADDHGAALGALRRSCEALRTRSDAEPLDIAALGGTVGDWRGICAAAAGLDGAAAARGFFESWFTPYEARNGARAEGLFTGYFEPELRGAEVPDALYTVPLYARPRDLVVVDLGLFRAGLAGERIAGQVSRGVLEPYPTRAQIDAGALAAKGVALVWVDDPVDAFFLHIQGSGRIAFEDGRTRRIAYAASNGHAYFGDYNPSLTTGRDPHRINTVVDRRRSSSWPKERPAARTASQSASSGSSRRSRTRARPASGSRPSSGPTVGTAPAAAARGPTRRAIGTCPTVARTADPTSR